MSNNQDSLIASVNQRESELIQRLMNEHSWPASQARYEMPAIGRITTDLEGGEYPPYGRTFKPDKNSYISQFVRKDGQYTMANNMLNNVADRVRRALERNKKYDPRAQSPEETSLAIANGAKALSESEELYRFLGLWDDIYRDKNVVENRYARAAEMYESYMNNPPSDSDPFENMGMPEKFDPSSLDSEANESTGDSESDPDEYDDDGDGDEEESGNEESENNAVEAPQLGGSQNPSDKEIKKFYEYIKYGLPYFDLISQFIDRCVDTPAKRTTASKIQDDMGDHFEIEDMDLDKIHRMTQDGLAMLASDRALTAVMIEDLTIWEQYKTESYKYIDVFVVDNSSSMARPDRIFKALAFIYNRLDKVIEGKAMLGIVEFDTGTRVLTLPKRLILPNRPSWMIETPEQAKWMQKYLIRRYCAGVNGGTNIPAGVATGVKMARKMEELGGVLPNITVVTDDDSSAALIDPSTVNMPVNGIGCANNSHLAIYCAKSGGMYNNLEQVETNPNKIKARL